MEKKKLFVVCSSHLDREWYVSYEQTRIYIDGVINRVLDILARQPDYRFMLDGQTSVLEDYLEIYPEREEEIARFVQEGRLLIGPWYIQPDECLPIGESIARNLLLGEKISRRYGEPMKVGYVPDAFGHISQLPQIFTQFGIHNAFMSRGCPPGTRGTSFGREPTAASSPACITRTAPALLWTALICARASAWLKTHRNFRIKSRRRRTWPATSRLLLSPCSPSTATCCRRRRTPPRWASPPMTTSPTALP
ncbi:glycoside hydrolase family 38 N-terminal domain-containing protein [Hydrogeniiclostridium mannosilyticum]|uniref:glycoside hydrolase family 38 N-terminal domain-containing protein n=1 Tax=Hydrogeniiclostridium mannosilyticum TaxID=2764322 RepID=UPI001FA91E45|nr:hypothetical protein [Hydrogeniiclostridium mannosilyticum]